MGRTAQCGDSTEHRITLLSVALQCLERLFYQLTPELLLFLGGHTGITDYVNNAVPKHQAIGSDHFRDRQRRSYLHRGDAGFFQFRGDRSAAARAGSSRRSENDRVDPQTPGFLGHLTAHAARVR
jgi:hypothetical protein